jgi:hypothetical protein
LLNSFNKAYEKVKTEKQKNLASRSALEDEFNFTISEKEPVKILEMDNKSYYNILIERAVVDSTYFENLFLIIDNSVAVEDVSAYIVKYTPSTISHNTTHHSFNFQGDIKVNPLVQRMTYNCYTVCVTICHDLVQNSEYSEPHVLGIYCTGNNTTEECSTECKWTNDGGSSSDEDASTGQSDTGFGTNTSGGGSSSAGNASSPPNDCGVCNPHLPVVPVKDLPEEEDFGPPCPGDPIKSPTICPSSIGNKAGGTYGCTRNNPEKTCEGYIGKKKHGGLDIQGKVNDHVYNMHSGKVISFRNTFGNVEYKKDSLGNFVEIESVVNGQVIRIKYCHLANVPQYGIGQIINQGIMIGDIGRSGNAGDPNVKTHLHLQTKQKNGTIWQPSNPINYLNTTFNSNFMPLTTNCN